VIQECLEQWEKGPEIPKDMHILIGVCEDIIDGNTSVSFTDERVRQATKWLSMLNRPRKR